MYESPAAPVTFYLDESPAAPVTIYLDESPAAPVTIPVSSRGNARKNWAEFPLISYAQPCSCTTGNVPNTNSNTQVELLKSHIAIVAFQATVRCYPFASPAAGYCAHAVVVALDR